MNEQELRVGNWVFLKSQNLKAYKIHSGSEITTGCDSDDFESISLDNPILAKHRTAYFFKLGNGSNYKIDENMLRIVKQQFNKNTWIPVLICEENEIKLQPVHCLHELQNLFYVLTGKELEIVL